MEKVYSNGLLDLENSLRLTTGNIDMDSKVVTESSLLARETFTKDSGNKVKDMEKELWSIRMGLKFKMDFGIKAYILDKFGKKRQSRK